MAASLPFSMTASLFFFEVFVINLIPQTRLACRGSHCHSRNEFAVLGPPSSPSRCSDYSAGARVPPIIFVGCLGFYVLPSLLGKALDHQNRRALFVLDRGT